MRIFDTVIGGLGSAIGLYEAKHRVLAENIANVDTPGYRARDIDFGSALAHAFEADAGTGTGTAADGSEIVVNRKAKVKIDGNSVELDGEMSRLSENAYKLVALSRILSQKYTTLRAAMGDGSNS